MKSIPDGDLAKWKGRLLAATPSVVLREMAESYGVNRSALGFMIADLFPGDSLHAVQAVWNWDFEKSPRRGISDAELDALLG
jgi:hypothetical protein